MGVASGFHQHGSAGSGDSRKYLVRHEERDRRGAGTRKVTELRAWGSGVAAMLNQHGGRLALPL